MNLHLENINLSSNTGPNSFANKLVKYATGCSFDTHKQADAHLCFIETNKRSFNKPLFLRLDGIYVNTAFDFIKQNSNIKRTYHMAKGVIFQSEFAKKLIFKRFGKHKNSIIIKNGADLAEIKKTEPLNYNKYDNLWTCASNWRPHKRMSSNINFFLDNASKNDGLIVAGHVPENERTLRDNIHYVGNLNQKQLFALYKKAKFFIHLASLDCCPNVVVDARACGCKIVCTDSGGTIEIAVSEAVILKDLEWDFEPLDLYNPFTLDFNILSDKKGINSDVDMTNISSRYINFIKENL